MISKLPGLIDVHVHLREPAGTHKEDFYTGTRAAVKGGFTFVIDMPNNPGAPTISAERLEEKIALSKKAVCNVGFHFGTNGKNLDEFSKIWDNPRVFGLKIYMSHTTGELLMSNDELLINVFNAWKCQKPILVHAEGERLAFAIELAKKYNRKLHVCHVSLASEVDLIRNTKHEQRIPISAGVTPHHLFLTEGAIMKPPLNTQHDKEALWQGIKDGTIDLIETDHAPHLRSEQAFGVPGLETALGLMGLAVHDKRLTINNLVRLMHDNPRRIFNIPDAGGYLEVDFEKSYTVAGPYETKCNWSPFEGWTLYGKIKTHHINQAV